MIPAYEYECSVWQKVHVWTSSLSCLTLAVTCNCKDIAKNTPPYSEQTRLISQHFPFWAGNWPQGLPRMLAWGVITNPSELTQEMELHCHSRSPKMPLTWVQNPHLLGSFLKFDCGNCLKLELSFQEKTEENHFTNSFEIQALYLCKQLTPSVSK